MLVLTRKPSEQIVIGSDVIITVLKVEGNKVRIGIEAPQDVSIRRDELTKKQKPAVSYCDVELVNA